jgi:fumarylacetoacetase
VSWVDYENDSPFPIQNIPFGAAAIGDEVVPVAAIGQYAINLRRLAKSELIDAPFFESGYGLDGLLSEGANTISEVRRRLYELLHEDESALQDDHALQSEAFHEISAIRLMLPFKVRSFVDFYSGIHHASNVGRMFRPDQPPLLPNYRWIPIGYNGRASSVVVSGTEVIRPKGQTKSGDAEPPIYGPTKELDFELEFGYAVAGGTEMGDTLTPEAADAMMAGLMIVNDWSARDVQRWEYQPLGPFLAKSFATSVSPWLVTLDALEPFRRPGPTLDPPPLAYLETDGDYHFDIQLEVTLKTAQMSAPQVISRSNTKDLYWSMAQQLAHQSSNGTNLCSGDLYGTGTISGETESAFGSLLELTWRGTKPIMMGETAERRTFLEDGDVLTMAAYAQSQGFRIGFGEVTGRIGPARA